MNKDKVIELVKNNIEVKKEIVEALQGLQEKAKTISHYKSIDGRYTSKLSEGLPLTKEGEKNDGTKYKYSPLYIKEGYRNFEGKFSTLELNLHNYYVGKCFNVNDRLQEFSNGNYYEETRYIGNILGEQLKPENVENEIKNAINSLLDEIKTLEKELESIDEIIKQHNEAIKELKAIIEYRDGISYTTRKCIPDLDLPYINMNDLIA